jgi:lipopolysaccharide/colanic/teichoic acid biosynthesis glycosyltransferase
MYRKYIKRILDFFVALTGLILLFPVFILIAFLIALTDRKNPFFFHQRPGKNGRIFRLVKFRTLNDEKDESGKFLSDIQRITKTGVFLRKYSLDELPNLWNVLRGDMSLVGPRPLLIEYLPLYSPEQSRRHDICPGITGWAQINGRNAISWQQKFKLDVWYVDHLSLSLDLKIIGLTIENVFKAKNVNASEELVMEWFNGEN